MPLDTKWLAEDLIEDRLLTTIFSKLLQYFNNKNVMESIVNFCHDNRFSYAQVLKYKEWLCLKGIVTSEKQGRNEVLTITDMGKRLSKAHNKFIETLRDIDETKN